MSEIRKIKTIIHSKPTMDGAGVELNRVFGYADIPLFDPFLLLDDFGSDDPDKYIAGFPFHPHRGIETVTYLLKGEVEHEDSIGNKGVIRSGGVQWMTAGSGIIHQEMPAVKDAGSMRGFQLWLNLPATQKMIAPRYQELSKDQIPAIISEEGMTIRVICGKFAGVIGPVRDIITDPEYMDITLLPNRELIKKTIPTHTVFSYIVDGDALISESMQKVEKGSVVLYEPGDNIKMKAGKDGVRILHCAGKPLNEKIAWKGPIVMNSQEELNLAFEELQNNTFIK